MQITNHGDQTAPPVKYLISGATGNVGALVAERLLQCGHRPRVFVRNPKKAEALSYSEMTAKIGAVIGRRLKFESISDDEARKQLVAGSEHPESLDYHVSIFRAIREGRLASVTNTVQHVLGRPPITFEN
jgi:uncharacterized protein YbjT (DUF2867 family)